MPVFVGEHVPICIRNCLWCLIFGQQSTNNFILYFFVPDVFYLDNAGKGNGMKWLGHWLKNKKKTLGEKSNGNECGRMKEKGNRRKDMAGINRRKLRERIFMMRDVRDRSKWKCPRFLSPEN